MDGQYKRYVNLYRTSPLAMSKQQFAEERDKRRFLSYKFSVSSLSSREFSWPLSIYGDGSARIEALRQEFLRLEASLPAVFLHSAWRSHWHCQRWMRVTQLCTKPREFALALSILVSCMKPVVFRSIWHDAVGNYDTLLCCLVFFTFVVLFRLDSGMSHRNRDGRQPHDWISLFLYFEFLYSLNINLPIFDVV